MEIIRADKMGFCFGVKGAIESCYKYSKEISEGKKIYILGMLVHNEHVVAQLEKLGLKTIDEQDFIENKIRFEPQDTVIVRAHGTKREVYKKLQEQGVKIEDSACIFVKNIRKKILELEKQKEQIIFIGDKEHPEVQGIISYGINIEIFRDLDELKKYSIDSKKKYSVLTQTTLNKEKMEEIKKYLENNHMNVNIFNKICGATQERQEAVKKIAAETDLVLIVGGRKSSNTQKLFEISYKINSNTKLVSDETEIDLNWFSGCRKVGITAGASTPEDIIQKIENKLRRNFNA
ncbi:MAG: 4-hydroxy-3-methylbut-2-enyl diphosphate reductase [Fusobacteriaceae bacterium]